MNCVLRIESFRDFIIIPAIIRLVANIESPRASKEGEGVESEFIQ